MRASRLAIVALLCLVGFAGTAVVAGAPPPTQLCGVCGSGTAEGAGVDGTGIDGATGPGTLDIYVDEGGDSRWSARVPVTDSAAERYRTNESALEAAVDDAWARYHAAADEIGTVERTADGDRAVNYAAESTVDGNAVVVNYTVDDLARSGVGDAWIVDYFADGSSNTRYRLAAERVTLHTPQGTAVTNRPAHASVDGTTATWTRREDGSGGFDGRTYVTYGEDGVVGTASGYATIGLEVGPTVLEHGVRGGAALGLLVGFVGFAVCRTNLGIAAFDAATLERLIAAVGAIGAAGFLVVGAVATDAGLAPGAAVLASLGVGYVLLGSGARRLGRRLETRGLVGLSLLATVVAGGVTVLLAGPPVYAVPLWFGAATALYLPMGYAAERGRFPVALVAGTALAPIAAIASVAPVSAFGYGPVLYGLLLLPWVATVAAFGYPLALLGRRLALGVD